jgi:hypothetical protein
MSKPTHGDILPYLINKYNISHYASSLLKINDNLEGKLK